MIDSIERGSVERNLEPLAEIARIAIDARCNGSININGKHVFLLFHMSPTTHYTPPFNSPQQGSQPGGVDL